MANQTTAPIVPAIPQLRKQDYPDGLGSQAGLDKFFTLLNPFFQSIGNALDGSLSIGNLNGEIISFQVTTPTTDWVTVGATGAPAFQNGWVGFTGGYSVQFRKDSMGVVWITGRVSTGTAATTIFTLPAGYLPSAASPLVLFAAKGSAAAGTTGSFSVSPSTGVVAQVDGTNGDLSLNCAFPSTGAGVLSCFPKLVRLVGQGQPADVWLTGITDANNAAASNAAIPAFAPGAVAWQRVNATQSGVNQIQINNISGLALGRTYNVRCWVQYSGGSGAAGAGISQSKASAAGSNG